MKIYVITHVFQGILQDVRAFAKEEDADHYEKDLCEENGIPYDAAEREIYYREHEVDDDIQKWIVDLAGPLA